MGGELLISPSTNEALPNTDSAFSYTDIFIEHYSYYILMGMTYEEFWEKDPDLVKSYRRADKIKRNNDNFDKWLQGKYFYDALIMVSPLLHAFSSETKPIDYHEKPLPLTKEEAERQEEERQKAKFEQLFAKMIEFKNSEIGGRNG